MSRSDRCCAAISDLLSCACGLQFSMGRPPDGHKLAGEPVRRARKDACNVGSRPGHTPSRPPLRRAGRQSPARRHRGHPPDAMDDPAEPRPAGRAAGRGGDRAHPQRRHADPGGNRHPVPQRRGAASAEGRRLRRRHGHEARPHGPRLRHGAGEEGAEELRHHAAQSRAQGERRRRHDAVRQRIEPAERHGPRPRPPPRRPRELSRLHEAHAVFQLHPSRRRLSGRAGRHPRLRSATSTRSTTS